MSIPNECLFDGAPLRDFSAATSTSDTSEVLDENVNAARLASG